MATDRDALMSAGELALREGRIDQAESLFAKMVEQDPQDLDAMLLLGIVAAKTGNADTAISSLNGVLEAEPDNLQALSALSHFLRTRGQVEEALQLAVRAARLNPQDAITQHNLGRCYLSLGGVQEAAECLSKALGIDPNVPAIHQDMAVAFQRQGRIGDAVAALERSIALAPREPEGYALLAHLFLNYGNFDRAVVCLRRAYELEPNSARGLTRLAFALTEDGQNEEAEKTARAAIAMAPKSADAVSLLGRLLQNKGEFQEAERCLEQAIEMDPGKLGPYYRLVIGRKITEADRELIARMESILERRDLTDADRALIEYALGKSYDDLAEYEAAMRHLDEANRLEFERLKASGRRYHADLHKKQVDQAIQTYTPELFAKLADSGSSSELPVFIVGMERSGTSLVEQIVSSHPLAGGAGELPFWVGNGPMIHDAILQSVGQEPEQTRAGAPPTLSQIAEEYLRTLSPYAEGKSRVTDKMPGNIAVLGQIHAVFPKAKIVWCLRNPIDNCLSIYQTAFRGGAAYLNNRENIVLAYRRHLELLHHWRSVLPASCFMEVRYEDLVADSERITRQTIIFLGLDWNDSCLRPEENLRGVKTPSVWQARQPIYRTSTERHRNFEPWLREFADLRDAS